MSDLGQQILATLGYDSVDQVESLIEVLESEDADVREALADELREAVEHAYNGRSILDQDDDGDD